VALKPVKKEALCVRAGKEWKGRKSLEERGDLCELQVSTRFTAPVTSLLTLRLRRQERLRVTGQPDALAGELSFLLLFD
jgi:hypothetical protein